MTLLLIFNQALDFKLSFWELFLKKQTNKQKNKKTTTAFQQYFLTLQIFTYPIDTSSCLVSFEV